MTPRRFQEAFPGICLRNPSLFDPLKFPETPAGLGGTRESSPRSASLSNVQKQLRVLRRWGA